MVNFDGFVRVANGMLVDSAGNPLQLRGVGLGNWHLPEGYMWRFANGGPASPREIEALIEDLVGPQRAAEFWQQFRAKFITEEDISMIAALGFDHIRLPLNSRYLIDDTGVPLPGAFDIVDRVIDWCRTAGLWVVIDLHGAPGGQTGTNIDDAPAGRPELFENAEFRKQTIDLWGFVADRYSSETVVAGYDLLNEPLPEEWQHRYPKQLVSLYKDLTAAIRAVDPNHVIIYEGTHWATNWEIFTEVWDDQSVLQFHKYWSPPDLPSIAEYLEVGKRLQLPIYMGEGGENNPDWLATAFGLYDDSGISWNFWPWKKIDTLTSPLSVNAPEGWSAILEYAAGRGPKPAADDAQATLDKLLDSFAPGKCASHPEIVNTLLRRPPLELPAIAYGHGSGDYLFTEQVSDGVLRRNEGAPIYFSGPEELTFDLHRGRPFSVEKRIYLQLSSGDYVTYHFELPVAATVEIAVRGVGEEPVVTLGSSEKTQHDEVNSATGLTIKHKLPAGPAFVKVAAAHGQLQLRRLSVAVVA